MAERLGSEQDMKSLAAKFKTALTSFTSSSSKFRILSTITPPADSNDTDAAVPQPNTLYVLDSSFNPPHRAHLQIALSALKHDGGSLPKRLLLLLAIQNADKAPKPAAFEQRLALMNAFANDLISASSSNAPKPIIDIAVTKYPYFADKAAAIDEDGTYPGVEQVHCTGYDTLIRILNPKYYPPEHTLKPVAPFLERHRLRVTYRASESDGGREEQDQYLEDLRSGKREHEGGKREWADKITMIEEEGLDEISSTNIRKACKSGDAQSMQSMLTPRVQSCVTGEKLYLES